MRCWEGQKRQKAAGCTADPPRSGPGGAVASHHPPAPQPCPHGAGPEAPLSKETSSSLVDVEGEQKLNFSS